MVEKKRSLMFRLMTAVNIATLIILVSMTAFILSKTTAEVESQIDGEVSSLIGSLQFTLADYVKKNDLTNLETMTREIADDSTINEVFIYNKDKKLMASAKNKDPEVFAKTKKPYNSNAEILKLGEEKNGAVGSIHISYNHNRIQKIKNEFYMISAVAIVTSQFILAFIMWLALSKSIKTINITTDKLRELSESTSRSSKEVENISEEVSSSANEQAASIQETVATLDEITSQVTTTVDSVNNSTKKSEESWNIATEGKVVVTEMIQSMEDIGQSNRDIMDEIAKGNERIGGIVKIINEISQKTAVINDIVFQTKLLSFNASVEAARAGEHGKGFAVVAEEVGKLAQMSGTASTEISAILSDSIVKVNSVIEETNANVKRLTDIGGEKVSSGMKIADRCGTVLEDIVTNATIVKNMMSEISVASKEQAEGVRNIAAAMNQLDQATLNNNKSAAMSSENAKSLSQLSISLQLAVTDLQKEIFGGEQSAAKVNKVVKIKEAKKEIVQTQESKKEVKKESKKLLDTVQSKKPEPKKAEPKNNVLPMVAKKEAAPASAPKEAPKSKGTSATPGYDDPRFEDV